MRVPLRRNPLRDWRQTRRETGFWQKARVRSASMREIEIVENVELALMSSGQAITRYRNAAGDRDTQLSMLFELRMNLEAGLGMMENVLPD